MGGSVDTSERCTMVPLSDAASDMTSSTGGRGKWSVDSFAFAERLGSGKQSFPVQVSSTLVPVPHSINVLCQSTLALGEAC